MKLIDSSAIAVRLRVAMENLFAVSNQAAYIGIVHRSATPLTRCMIDRLHSSLDDLGQIVKEIEPKVIDTGSLTLDEALVLEGYAEIRRGLVKSWQFVEAREQAILRQARGRINAGRDNEN
jgi:hypothetical protein